MDTNTDHFTPLALHVRGKYIASTILNFNSVLTKINVAMIEVPTYHILCVSARQCPSPVTMSMMISLSKSSMSQGVSWRGSVFPLPTPLPLPNEYTCRPNQEHNNCR